MLTNSINKDIRQLQDTLLRAILAMSIVFNALFVIADLTKINVVGSPQLEITIFVMLMSAAMLFAVIRNPGLFNRIAGLMVIQSFGQFTSALVFVPQDELRIVWFFVLIGGSYLLLGRRVGVACTAGSVLLLLGINPYLTKPYSSNALTTCALALALNGVLFHIFSVFFNRLYEGLLTVARHDPLTGVLNSRAYYEVCEAQIRLCKRLKQPFSVIFIDLDYFKRINDQFGHQVGDEALKSVADCINSVKRDSDCLGRVGGEEFSLFLPYTDINGALKMAERARCAIESNKDWSDSAQSVPLTASVGVSQQSADRWNMADIEREADHAMYRAKNQGRNRVVAFEPANN